MSPRLRYRYLVPLAASLPEWVLRLLVRHWKLCYDPSDGIGWTFWLDASYARYCRFDMALWGGRS